MRLTRGDVVAAFRPCFEELPIKAPDMASWVWLADEDLGLPLDRGGSLPPFLLAPYEVPSGWRVRVLYWGGTAEPWTVATFNCPDKPAAVGLTSWLGTTMNGAWGCHFPMLGVVA